MEKTLVAVDGSDPSMKALDYAIEEAKELESEITIIQVVNAPSYKEKIPDEVLSEEIKNVSGYLEGLKEKFGNEKIKLNTKVLKSTNVASEIVDYAEKEDFDKIVVGGKGKTGLETITLGSVSESVVKKASCPVLVVH
ncbi:MAG: universal stress protein [Hadesarchaea archaeon]|nr:universal stress protein [Hadesarchaea archaeon]